MKSLIRILILTFMVSPSIPEARAHTIYVVSISWHTGILIPVTSIPDSLWPDSFKPQSYDYLEIGWGDRDYFQHPGFNIWYAIKAVCWPTPSALHVMPLHQRHIPGTYTGTTLVQLSLKEEALHEMTNFLISHFTRDEKGQFVPLKEGFYPMSQFFAGEKKYFFPDNSNVWAARALKKAGFPYAPLFFQTTGMVVRRAARFGKIVPPDE